MDSPNLLCDEQDAIFSPAKKLTLKRSPTPSNVNPGKKIKLSPTHIYQNILCNDTEFRLQSLEFLMELEKSQYLSQDYMLTPRMSDEQRQECLHRLFLIKKSFQIPDDVVHGAMNYIDRFLSLTPTFDVSILKLVTDSCFYLALNLETIVHLKEYCAITQNQFDAILSQWQSIFRKLSYQLRVPITPELVRAMTTGEENMFAIQLCNLCLVEHGFLRFSFSTIAAVSLHVACQLQPHTEGPTLAVSRGLTFPDLKECMDMILDIYNDPSRGQKVKDICQHFQH